MDSEIIIPLIFLVIIIFFGVRAAVNKKESQEARITLKEEDFTKEIDKIEKLTANEAKEKLGCKDWSVLSPDLIQMKYIGGIDDLDAKVYLKSIICLKGLELIFQEMRYGLLSGNIKYWTVENKREIIGTKSKSVVGRALAGGLLFGPVGAIIGGLTGIGKKNITLNNIENVITFSYQEEDKERIILFSCRDKYLKKIFNSLKESTFGDKFKNPSELLPDKQTDTKNEFSVADELKKLKELLHEGILTDEEFEKQKEKLLNK